MYAILFFSIKDDINLLVKHFLCIHHDDMVRYYEDKDVCDRLKHQFLNETNTNDPKSDYEINAKVSVVCVTSTKS